MNTPQPTSDVIAIIQTFNEELILESTLRHLISQNIDVYIFDNGSTDSTRDIAARHLHRGVIAIEIFIDPANPGHYDLKAILTRKTHIAQNLARDRKRWIIHYDADEIRESPWPGVSLHDGLRRAASLGYNTVNHVLINFAPTDESYRPDLPPTDQFRFYIPVTRPIGHGKAWIQGKKLVDLVTGAGHFVAFPGQRVFPIPFLIKHFPILNTAHGQRKVLRERKPRYDKERIAQGWHKHYNHIHDESHNFIQSPDNPDLIPYDDLTFKQTLLANHPLPPPTLLNRLFRTKRPPK